MKKVNLCNDIIFKELFKSVEARGMVASFLSALINIPKEDLMKADYISEELNRDNFE